jgi:hypothetical protein
MPAEFLPIFAGFICSRLTPDCYAQRVYVLFLHCTLGHPAKGYQNLRKKAKRDTMRRERTRDQIRVLDVYRIVFGFQFDATTLLISWINA